MLDAPLEVRKVKLRPGAFAPSELVKESPNHRSGEEIASRKSHRVCGLPKCDHGPLSLEKEHAKTAHSHVEVFCCHISNSTNGLPQSRSLTGSSSQAWKFGLAGEKKTAC